MSASPEPVSPTSFDARVVLRPRKLDETLDLAVAYARTYWRDFAALSALVVLPYLLAIVGVAYLTDLDWAGIWALAFIAAPLIERVVVGYTGSHLFGNDPRPLAGLSAIRRRPVLAMLAAVLIPLPLLPALATNLESEAWIGIGILVGMAWPFLLAHSLYVSVVVVLERQPLRDTFKRASSLVGPRYARALGFVCLGFGARCLAVAAAELGAWFVISFMLQLGAPIDRLLENGGSWPAIAGFLVAAPMVALARTFDYVDARTVQEGWDIQVRFNAIAERARAARAKRYAA